MSNNDTPRTDAHIRAICEGNQCFGYVQIDLARTLERETQQQAKRIQELEAALRSISTKHPGTGGTGDIARAILNRANQ